MEMNQKIRNNSRAQRLISFVIPAYNEETNLRQLYYELIPVIRTHKLRYEIIFVDDGSSDRTWDVVEALRKEDKHIRGIRFSRNFGHQYALFAGFSAATGDAVICMDADLQHPPRIVPELIQKWEEGYRIVHTIRQDAKNLSFFKKLSSKLFYALFSFLTSVKIKPGMADFRLLDRQALESILRYNEDGLFLRGIVHCVGFPSAFVEFQSNDRFSGTTKYTLRNMIKFAVAGVTSFSIIPLRVGIIIGILTSLFSFYLIIDALFVYFAGETVPGWTTMIIAMSFMFGILFILLGLLGEYIGRILIEVKNRPRYIIQDELGIDIPAFPVKRASKKLTIKQNDHNT
jgi:polyisoprenyl-phosphate glycosyltransferase